MRGVQCCSRLQRWWQRGPPSNWRSSRFWQQEGRPSTESWIPTTTLMTNSRRLPLALKAPMRKPKTHLKLSRTSRARPKILEASSHICILWWSLCHGFWRISNFLVANYECWLRSQVSHCSSYILD